MPQKHIDELPRERLLNKGSDALTDKELIAVLLRTGTQGKPVLELAQEILDSANGNLLDLSRTSVKDLCKISGIGEAKAVGLAASFALARRLLQLKLEEGELIDSPDTVADYIRNKATSPDQEEAHVLLFDTRERLIKDTLVSIGTLNKTISHPREVFREAIRESAAAIIFVHTHPSFDPTPSDDDIKLTITLSYIASIIDIEFRDHVIVAMRPKPESPHYFSFLKNGLLDLEKFAKESFKN
ncbi:MAG: DNA repair protein RadC [Lentisphaerae bacterium]|jgi:DNA repair protein RadC|nr:DNA repair protein RadC [Lentisphaerota bacterium]